MSTKNVTNLAEQIVPKTKYSAEGFIAQELEDSLLNYWDARIVNYDKERFDFAGWVLQRVNINGYKVNDLRYLHEAVGASDSYKLTKKLCEDTNLPEFQRLVRDFVREVIVPEGHLEKPVGVQRFLNVRIMQPAKPQGIFPFHTGLLYGHGPASRSIWMPMTDVSAEENYTASMQIIGLKRSRELVQEAIDKRYTIDGMTERFGAESWPLKMGPGNVCFFTQENIHGNFVNVTGKTRVSIDFRIAESKYGNMLARKIAGGYFGIIPDTAEEEKTHVALVKPNFDNGKPNVLYLANATPATDGAPVHLQRYMVLEYCKRHNIPYEFEYFELDAMTHLPTLRHAVEAVKSNVVLYSIYSLPPSKSFRSTILDAAFANGVILHFVNENVTISNDAERQNVERMLEFAKATY